MTPSIPALLPLPAFEDNYIWLLHDGVRAVAVDPGEAAPILSWLAARRMTLEAVLITHHHGDHTGDLDELLASHPCPVYGPAEEAIDGVSHPLRDGMTLTGGLLEGTRVLAVPGHTLGHLAYLAADRLFCGDTLFSCGCGRLFEGSPAQMHASLNRLAALPDATQVCCAHEYTLANLRFALRVDPDNPALRAWRDDARRLRKAGRPTLPVPLGLEKAINPFLRCGDATIQARIGAEMGRPPVNSLETFTFMRNWKNSFP